MHFATETATKAIARRQLDDELNATHVPEWHNETLLWDTYQCQSLQPESSLPSVLKASALQLLMSAF